MSHTTYKLYLVTHLASGMQYVGVTRSKLRYRMTSHRSKGPMASMLQREGMSAVTFSVIDEFDDREAALIAEAATIKRLGTHTPAGFNGQVRGGKYPGRGGGPAGNTNSRRKMVHQCSLDGEIIRAWPTVKEAADVLSIARNTIHRCLRRPDYSAGGFKWKVATPATNGG